MSFCKYLTTYWTWPKRLATAVASAIIFATNINASNVWLTIGRLHELRKLPNCVEHFGSLFPQLTDPAHPGPSVALNSQWAKQLIRREAFSPRRQLAIESKPKVWQSCDGIVSCARRPAEMKMDTNATWCLRLIFGRWAIIRSLWLVWSIALYWNNFFVKGTSLCGESDIVHRFVQ